MRAAAAAAAGLGMALLAGCASSPAGRPPADGPVTDAAVFSATLVGRDLVEVESGAVLRISADGSWLERRRNHITASGLWHWNAAGWCHEGRRDGVLFGLVCARVEREAATARVAAPGQPARLYRVSAPGSALR